MAVFLAPVGLATAAVDNTLAVQAIYKESLRRKLCVVASNQPNATVTYTHETPVLNGTVVFVPIVATVTINYPDSCCSQTITERFFVSFQGQTATPTSVTINVLGRVQGFYKVICGKSDNYSINDSITVTIA